MKALWQFFLHPTSRALGLSLFTLSILLGSWVTRIPDVKASLALNEAQLGIALLGISIGGLLAMPFTPFLIKRLGTGKTLVLSNFAYCILPVLPVFAPSLFLLILALAIVGAVGGILDVSANAAVVTVEKNQKIAIMSACHGMFSLGGMIGGIIGSIMAGWGVAPWLHILSIGILMIIVNIIITPTLLKIPEPEANPEGGAIFSLPKRALLGLAITAFCIMVGEGAVADWSAVYLEDTLKSNAFLVGMGFAAFNLTMMLGRFFGDQVIAAVGSSVIVKWGIIIGVIGAGVAVMTNQPFIAILGFALIGLGFSVIVPIIFRAAANVPGVPSELGVASVSTTGFLGFLIGPPAIGFVAEEFGLRMGLGLVLVLSVIAFFVSLKVKV